MKRPKSILINGGRQVRIDAGRSNVDMRSARLKMVFGVVLVVTVLPSYARAELPQDAPQAPDGSEDIVVNGRLADPDKTVAETRAISNTHDGQLARFETPICPNAIGLAKPQAAVVEARIRVVAEMAGVRLGKPACAPNLIIVVADDGAAFVDALHRQRPNLFSSLSLSDLRKLSRSSGPSWTWQSISPKRRDGGSVERISQVQFGNGPPLSVAKGAYIASNVELSRLSMPVRQDTDLSFVVFSHEKVAGLTLQQLSDYSAMVGLAAIRTAKAEKLTRPSILTMFQDISASNKAQPEATAFDLAYLKGLYAGESGFSSDQKSAAIASQINRSYRKR